MAGIMDYLTGFAGMVSGPISQAWANSQNEHLIDKRNRLAIEQWNRENAYNNPINQMLRLKAAGLNPNLMYGNLSGQLGAAASPDMASAQVSPTGYRIDPLTAAQIENIRANTEKTRGENRREDEKQGLVLKNLSADFDLKVSQSDMASSSSALNSALEGESKQRAENLRQQWEQSNKRFEYDLEILSSQATISKETAMRTARQLEAAISQAESMASYYKKMADNADYDKITRRIAANAASSQASTSEGRLIFEQNKWDDGHGNGLRYYYTGDLELKLSELRKNMSQFIINMQKADLFDDTKFAQYAEQYLKLIGAVR